MSISRIRSSKVKYFLSDKHELRLLDKVIVKLIQTHRKLVSYGSILGFSTNYTIKGLYMLDIKLYDVMIT